MNILNLYNRGMSWDQFVASEEKHGPEMINNLQNMSIDADTCEEIVGDEIRYFVCLGEGWCPDTSQQFSLIQKITQITGVEASYFHSDDSQDDLAPFNEENGDNFIPLILLADNNGNLLHSIRGRAPMASNWSNNFKAGRDPKSISMEEWQKGRAMFMDLYCTELYKETVASLMTMYEFSETAEGAV